MRAVDEQLLGTQPRMTQVPPTLYSSATRPGRHKLRPPGRADAAGAGTDHKQIEVGH